jgi:alcohol dehydrogenase class IV
LLADLGSMVAATGQKRVLLVTDPGMMATDIVGQALASLDDAGIESSVYSDVEADPPESVVHAACDAARAADAGLVIGLGGGSSMDAAKLVALLVSGHQQLSEAYGVGNAVGPRLPLILVPTTAGTGSEVTPISIITTGKSEKMGVVSPVILPDIALLDPGLTMSVPPHVTAATGIDAMVHAIEAYASASANNNPISRQLALQALGLLGGAVERAVHDGSDRQARADMLLGAMLAGQAFANSPVAAVHALAYPIGGHFKIPHGLSNALVLAHVLRFNAVVAPAPYAEMAPYVFPAVSQMGPQEAAAAFAEEMAALAERCGLEARLRDVGIPQDALDLLARDAMNQTRLLVNNPRPVEQSDARAIYQAAW